MDGGVGAGEHLVLVGEGGERRDRSEDLLVQDPGVVGDVDEDGRGVEVAGPAGCAALRGDPRAAGDGVVDERADLVDGPLVDHRSEGDAVLQAGSDAYGGHGGAELLGELGGDVGVDVEPVGGDADLAAAAHLRVHRAAHGRVDVGVRADHEGGVAAQLHGDVDDVRGGLLQEHLAGGGGAGEGELADPFVAEPGRDDLGGAVGGQDVQQAFGQAGFGEQRGDREGGERGLRSGLEQDGAAGREGRGDLAGGHGGREVPGGDEGGDADGVLAYDVAVAAGRGVPEGGADADGLLGEPAEELGGVADLGRRVPVRLAVLQDDEPGESVGVLAHQREGVVQDLRTATGRCRTPADRCRVRGVDRRAGVVRSRGGDVADEVAGGRVVDGVGPSVGGREPSAAEEHIAFRWWRLGQEVDAGEVHELLFSPFRTGLVRCAVNLRARHGADKATSADRNGGCSEGNSPIMGGCTWVR